ncbi:DUF3373 domain-containing protein [Sulfurovum sp. bin170]|uniref:DUF3373 family protein n=1 Tax=Sulfurovum sp. bin170 TaxID=2695268 RepID=UPI0013DF7C0F|nr:DUF3373 family protein [Sulfurovum sp. bin170]NEW61735.1 DUF3373 domain-containing protein [Sulfurovum sp. bin170]
MKKIVGISIVTATMLMAGGELANMDNRYDENLRAELEALKSEVAELRKGSQSKGDSDNSKLEKKIKKLSKKLSEIKAHDAKDNIKWSVDFRTSMDSIEYTMADGSKRENSDLFANRLWLNMAYSPTDKVIFKGQLAYNKAYGATLPDNGGSTFQRGFSSGFDGFDWVINENLTDNTMKLRQAYWLYLGDDFLGTGLGWTASVGRRPSTTGFLANLREDDVAQSPLGHLIDVEFDGASSELKLEDAVGVPGMAFKVCMGQGATNAVARFDGNQDQAAYAGSSDVIEDIRLGGVIFTPYDDKQYTVKTTAYKAFNVPGFQQDFAADPTGRTMQFSTTGDMLGAGISLLVDGLTDDMDESEFLYETKLFASFAWSKSLPDGNNQIMGMMGPRGAMGAAPGEEQTGTSYWVGAQIPVSFLGGKLGAEYNQGSEYWRPFTYGEDTMVGSKLAARGKAFEIYYTQPLAKGLSAQIRWTKIDYDYTGSQGFFGAGGTPIKISDLKAGAAAGDPMSQSMLAGTIEEAQDIRAYIRYRF